MSEGSITFTGFSGCDMTVIQNDKVVGELQAITFRPHTRKAPVYADGIIDPRTFSRVRRTLIGSLVFTVAKEELQPNDPLDVLITWSNEDNRKAMRVLGVEVLSDGLYIEEVESCRQYEFIARSYEHEFTDYDYIERVVGKDDL